MTRIIVRALWVFAIAVGTARTATTADSPAQGAIQKFQRGVNLGNYLEAPPNQNWSAKYTEEDFKHIRAEGFDHVRLPIGWHHYAGPAPEYVLSDAVYAKVDFLVTNALNSKLGVIVNIHHFDAFTSDPSSLSNKFYALWRQIAAHYAKAPNTVAFELLNEPKDAATTTVMNPIYAEAIRRIRSTNPNRTIFVGPGKWNQPSELVNLHLPAEDRNIIVTVHCYDPFFFTHQSATWAGNDVKSLKGIVFPGPPREPFVPPPDAKLSKGLLNWIERYNTLTGTNNPSSPAAFRASLQKAKDWSVKNGRPIHVGEFGCYIKADPDSRRRFYTEFRKAVDELGLAWAMWDWKAGFRYWDDSAKRPAPGLREAMFGRSE
jgi:endoglucanase